MTDRTDFNKKGTNPLQKFRQWLGTVLAIVLWLYPVYQILTSNNSAAQLFDSDVLSAVLFSVFWWGIVGLMYSLQKADFTRDEDGNITGDSEIHW